MPKKNRMKHLTTGRSVWGGREAAWRFILNLIGPKAFQLVSKIGRVVHSTSGPIIEPSEVCALPRQACNYRPCIQMWSGPVPPALAGVSPMGDGDNIS